MHWCGLKTKSCRWFSAIINIYWHALGWPEHKIVSPIFSYQEHLLTCIDGTLTQNLFGGFQLSRKHINMHWWDLKTESVRRFAAIKNTYWHALVRPEEKIFSVVFSYQEYFLTCIGGTWTRNLFGDFQRSRILVDMHWWDLNTKSFRRFSAIKNTCDMHWWDLNAKSFRRFSAIKNTCWHALVWHEQKIVSLIFSYQEYLFTCIGGTWTLNLFGDFQLSRKLFDMHWRDFNTKSFLAIFSYQEYLLTCIGAAWRQNLVGDFQLSRIFIDMHWGDLNTKSFCGFSAIKNTYWHALMGH